MVGERVFKEVSEVKGANLTGVLTRTGERIQTGRGTARTDSRLPGRTEASRQVRWGAAAPHLTSSRQDCGTVLRFKPLCLGHFVR